MAKEVRWSTIYFIFFATILLATPSAAQTSDQVLGAIKAIAGSWQSVIQKQTLILAPCEIGTWHRTPDCHQTAIRSRLRRQKDPDSVR